MSDVSELAGFQHDMRRGYLGGATGVITSGLVWFAAGMVAYFIGPGNAIWTLFIGAGFIVPVSNLIDRALGAPGKHAPGNRLAPLALETTVSMLMCLPLAYGLSLHNIDWFFPAVMMIIGGRYLVFATIYGNRAYWLLGAALGIGALLAFRLGLPPHAAAWVGSGIELVFGTALLVAQRRARA
jgi:hypothetical protein